MVSVTSFDEYPFNLEYVAEEDLEDDDAVDDDLEDVEWDDDYEDDDYLTDIDPDDED